MRGVRKGERTPGVQGLPPRDRSRVEPRQYRTTMSTGFLQMVRAEAEANGNATDQALADVKALVLAQVPPAMLPGETEEEYIDRTTK
jgi:hypothetical protein